MADRPRPEGALTPSVAGVSVEGTADSTLSPHVATDVEIAHSAEIAEMRGRAERVLELGQKHFGDDDYPPERTALDHLARDVVALTKELEGLAGELVRLRDREKELEAELRSAWDSLARLTEKGEAYRDGGRLAFLASFQFGCALSGARNAMDSAAALLRGLAREVEHHTDVSPEVDALVAASARLEEALTPGSEGSGRVS